MNQMLALRWCCAPLSLLLFLAASFTPASADTKKPAPPDIFGAIQRELVEVKVIARDEKRVSLQIKNKTDKPVQLRVPDAFAVVPVLAQFQPQGLFDQGANRGARNPQVLGVGGPRNGNLNNRPNLFPGAVFNVPPGKVIRKRLTSVCLQYGLPEPNPRHAYEIKQLEDVSQSDELQYLLSAVGRGEVSQKIGQIAAWHLTDQMSWQELSRLTFSLANGRKHLRYSRSEVAQAKSVLERIRKHAKKKIDSLASHTRR